MRQTLFFTPDFGKRWVVQMFLRAIGKYGEKTVLL